MTKTHKTLIALMLLSLRVALFSTITEQEYIQEIKDLRELNKKLISKIKLAKDIQDKYIALKDDYHTLRLRYDMLKENSGDSFELKRKLDQANYEIKSLQEELADQKTSAWKLNKLEEEKQLLEQDNHKLFEDNKQLIEDNTNLKADNFFLLNKVNELKPFEEKVKGLELENQTLNEKLLNMNKRNHKLKERVHKKKREIRELEKALEIEKGNNTIAASPLVGELKRKIKEYIRANRTLRESVATLQQKNDEQHDKLLESKNKMNSLFVDLNMMSKKLEETDHLRDEVERQERVIFNLNNKVEAYKQQLLDQSSSRSSSHLLGMAN